MVNLSEENKNYQHLVDLAEGAFLKKEYLEAFLIQSCVIEGVIKNYAKSKLKDEIEQSQTLTRKFKDFELARLVDDLLLAGKILPSVYEELNQYRKTRNDVIHKLLEYTEKDTLDIELKNAYESGRQVKGLIVEDLTRENKEGATIAELQALLKNLQEQLTELESGGQ